MELSYLAINQKQGRYTSSVGTNALLKALNLFLLIILCLYTGRYASVNSTISCSNFKVFFFFTDVRSIIEKLGDDTISKITIIGTVEVEQSLYSQLVFGEGVSASLDEQLAKEVAKAGKKLFYCG